MSFTDYLNTLEFIKTVGDVGEAKSVFRNHVDRTEAVTTTDVLIQEIYYV